MKTVKKTLAAMTKQEREFAKACMKLTGQKHPPEVSFLHRFTPAERDAAIKDFAGRLYEFFAEIYDENPDDENGETAWHLAQEIGHIADGVKYVRPGKAD